MDEDKIEAACARLYNLINAAFSDVAYLRELTDKGKRQEFVETYFDATAQNLSDASRLARAIAAGES